MCENVYAYVSISSVIESPDSVGGRVSHLTRTSTRVATDESAALIICFWGDTLNEGRKSITEDFIQGRYEQGPRIPTPSRELPAIGAAINAGQPHSITGLRDFHTRPIINARHSRDFRASGMKFTCARDVKHERSICV